MKVFVFDTSALLRFYIPDGPLAPESEEIMDAAGQGNVTIMVPELLIAEVAQVLYKKERSGFLAASEAKLIQEEILRLPMDFISHKGLVEEASILARKHKLSVYDGFFLALAHEAKADLITCDVDLAKASKKV